MVAPVEQSWRGAAVWRWLDGHINRETGVGAPPGGAVLPAPTRGTIEQLLHTLGHPERGMPVVLVAGTNGKTTTARILARLLDATGLQVGCYTSPHLHRPHERIAIGTATITDSELAAALLPLIDHAGSSSQASWFELMTAAAVAWFADRQVDVAVVETGLGGAGDATAALGARLVAVTSVGVDHVEYFGPTRWDNAVAEAGAVPDGATLVLAEVDPGMHPPFLARRPGRVLLAGRDFGVAADTAIADGRTVSLFTPGAGYEAVHLGMHAPWQVASAAVALVTAETWLGAPLADRAVREVLAGARSPGRFELVHTPNPVVVDGAHNPAAAAALADALQERFGRVARHVVVGMTGARDALAFLDALGVGPDDRVICVEPRTPRAMRAGAIADAARALGADSVSEHDDIGRSVRAAAQAQDSLTVVTGSLYVAAEALPVARALAGKT